MSKFFTPSLALETIEFQTDDFARKLEVAFTKVIEMLSSWRKGPRALATAPEVQEIAKMTFERTGLQVRLHTAGMLAAVMPIYFNKNHIFIDKIFRGDFTIPAQQKFLNLAQDKTGSVDLKDARVSGIFSEPTVNVFMNFQSLVKLGLTAPMITAVYLHEVGHAFYTCEYTARMTTTNQVLAKLLRSRLNKETLKVEYVYRELQKATPNASRELAEALATGTIIPGVKAFKFLGEIIAASMPRSRYDETSFEALADSFPARWGYATQLVDGLEIISKNSPERVGYPLWNITDLISLAIIAALTIFSITTGMIFGALFYGLVFSFVTYFVSDKGVDMTYDVLNIRYKRIRQQLIEMLKDSDLGDAQAREQIDAIKQIDDILEKFKTTPDLAKAFANLVVPGARAERNSNRYQQLMEELAANDLFLKAAQFRTAN